MQEAPPLDLYRQLRVGGGSVVALSPLVQSAVQCVSPPRGFRFSVSAHSRGEDQCFNHNLSTSSRLVVEFVALVTILAPELFERTPSLKCAKIEKVISILEKSEMRAGTTANGWHSSRSFSFRINLRR